MDRLKEFNQIINKSLNKQNQIDNTNVNSNITNTNNTNTSNLNKDEDSYFYNEFLHEYKILNENTKIANTLGKIQKLENKTATFNQKVNTFSKAVSMSRDYNANKDVRMFFDGVIAYFRDKVSELMYLLNVKKNNLFFSNNSNSNFLILSEEEEHKIEKQRSLFSKNTLKTKNKTKLEKAYKTFYNNIKKEEQSFENVHLTLNQIDKIQSVLNNLLRAQNERIESIFESVSFSIDNFTDANVEIRIGKERKKVVRSFFCVFCNVTTCALIYLFFFKVLNS